MANPFSKFRRRAEAISRLNSRKLPRSQAVNGNRLRSRVPGEVGSRSHSRGERFPKSMGFSAMLDLGIASPRSITKRALGSVESQRARKVGDWPEASVALDQHDLMLETVFKDHSAYGGADHLRPHIRKRSAPPYPLLTAVPPNP
jgi:hypothetical protein